MAKLSVELTDHFQQFVHEEVASGRFASPNELVEQGLRLLEKRERKEAAKRAWLEAAIQEGLDDLEKGNVITLHGDEELEQFMKGLLDEVLAEDSSKA